MLYPDRPRIKLRLTPTDRIIEIIGWCIVVAMWCIVVINYSKLPETIPVHYNSVGQIDGYGNKSMIWGLLIIGSVFYAGLFLLSKIPFVFSYPTKITKENALDQYTTGSKIFRYLNLVICMIFGYLLLKTVKIALGSMAMAYCL